MADEKEAPKRSPQALFEDGLKALGEKRFDDAIAHLSAVREAGLTSAGVERALGQGYQSKGQPGLALEHMAYGLSLDRFSGRARSDYEWTQSQVEGGFGTRMNHPVEWGHRASTYLRWNEALFLSSLVFIAAAAARYFRPERRRLFYGLSALAVVGVLVSSLIYSGRSVTVLRSGSSLHANPLASSASLMELPAGTRVRVLRISGDYTEVERPSAFRGWIESAKLAPNPF